MTRQAVEISASITITSKTQANRIENLMSIAALTGSPFRFEDIRSYMSSIDLNLSRATWYNLRDPDTRVTRIELLHGLAEFFNVPTGFMCLEDAEMPQSYQKYYTRVAQERADEAAEAFFRQAINMDYESLKQYAFDAVIRRIADGNLQRSA